ncbi:MAG: hypothetical protein HKN45_07860 [Flavobacteriales bacterium]|nr:hypothetical protein [Flavobacteriales bacterium]
MFRLLAGCALLIAILFFSSCQEVDKKKVESSPDINKYQVDGNKEKLISLDGELVSIPSPLQSAIFIKENGSGFKQQLLLDAKDLDPYQTNSQKAIALGVYGAELGYVSLYEENDLAIGYMNTARKLADDVGISNAFDERLIERFSENMGKPDSLVVLVSDIYEAADSYLKTNERNDMAALILFGGWIESLYITGREAETGSEEVKQRLAEQKSGYERMYRLLQKEADNAAVKAMMPLLDELKAAFDKVSSKYVYQRPELRYVEQLTILKSKVENDMNDESMVEIINAITALRNHITGKK